MALAYIDTNIFLDFYQSAADRLGVFEDILARSNRILLTEQTVNEFRRNRVTRLMVLADEVNKASQVRVHTTAVVKSFPDYTDWVKARDAAKAAAAEIAKRLTSWIEDEQSDTVLQAFERLAATAKTIQTTPDLVARASTRKLLGAPPTSPDKYSIGDELNWECILSWAESDVVIVTRDRTYLHNQALLKREFLRATGKTLQLITDSLGDGLRAVGSPSERVGEAEASLVSTEFGNPPPKFFEEFGDPVREWNLFSAQRQAERKHHELDMARSNVAALRRQLAEHSSAGDPHGVLKAQLEAAEAKQASAELQLEAASQLYARLLRAPRE